MPRTGKGVGKRLPEDALAEGLVYFFKHLNGQSWRKMAEETGRNRQTIAKYAKLASDQMVVEAKERIMQELLPKAMELMRARMDWEIKELKEGRMPKDVNHADRFMKGMFLFDHEPNPEKEVPLQLNPGEEEVHTLAGLVATRQRRMAKENEPPKQIESKGEIIEGEIEPTKA